MNIQQKIEKGELEYFIDAEGFNPLNTFSFLFKPLSNL